ncbi:MAG TPA: hypothetical protein V6C82_00245, partial [Chroococcales cyanobacterium]
AKVIELPGTVTYGETPLDALAQVQAMALQAVAGMVKRGELPPEQVIAFNQIFNEIEGDASPVYSPFNNRRYPGAEIASMPDSKF